MSPDQVTGILRAVLAGLGGFILAKGWVSAELWQWLVGGVLTIAPGFWTWYSNKPSSIAAKAQNLTGVTVLTDSTTDIDVVKAVANAKVA